MTRADRHTARYRVFIVRETASNTAFRLPYGDPWAKLRDMAACETCGNDYWLAFEVKTISGDRHVFDSFECAIQRLAPICEHCGVKIVGHGVEVAGRFFCCAHCARATAGAEAAAITDTVGAHPG
jgi:hypothetical protein